MPPIWALSCTDSHFVNMFFVTVTLTFDLVTWKSIGVICQSWSMYLWSFMILGISVLELSSGNHFTISGHRDLDLWPSDLKINRGHLLVMINVPMKFHDPRPKRSWVIVWQPPGGRTDRTTDMSKAIYPLFFEGGNNKNFNIFEHAHPPALHHQSISRIFFPKNFG